MLIELNSNDSITKQKQQMMQGFIKPFIKRNWIQKKTKNNLKKRPVLKTGSHHHQQQQQHHQNEGEKKPCIVGKRWTNTLENIVIETNKPQTPPYVKCEREQINNRKSPESIMYDYFDDLSDTASNISGFTEESGAITSPTRFRDLREMSMSYHQLPTVNTNQHRHHHGQQQQLHHHHPQQQQQQVPPQQQQQQPRNYYNDNGSTNSDEENCFIQLDKHNTNWQPKKPVERLVRKSSLIIQPKLLHHRRHVRTISNDLDEKMRKENEEVLISLKHTRDPYAHLMLDLIQTE